MEKQATSEKLVVDDNALGLPERYVIESELGRGGMGIVYRAQHRISGQKLAIKILKDDIANDATHIKRFRQEATAIAKLNSPHLIRLVDFDVTPDGRAFMVTELLEGASLKDKLAQGVLPPDEFYRIMLQVCDGLAEAHKHKIIHRDIKPSNIMLDAQGNARLMDFGIARDSDPDKKEHTLTGTGEIIGSPEYMSPEQATGHQVDARSDIFSLGCTMYEMLVGKTPFEGANAIETIVNRMNNEAVRIDKLRPEASFPEALIDVVARCLKRDPQERYYDIAALRADLAAAQAGKKQYTTRRRVKMTPVTYLGIAAAALAVLVASIAFRPVQRWEAMQQAGLKSYNAGHLTQAQNQYAEAARFAIRAGQNDYASQCYETASTCAYRAGDMPQYAHYDQLAGDNAANDGQKVKLYEAAGAGYRSIRDYPDAQRAYKQLIEVARRNPADRQQLISALSDGADAAYQCHDYKQSKAWSDEAISLLSDESSPSAEKLRQLNLLAGKGLAK